MAANLAYKVVYATKRPDFFTLSLETFKFSLASILTFCFESKTFAARKFLVTTG